MAWRITLLICLLATPALAGCLGDRNDSTKTIPDPPEEPIPDPATAQIIVHHQDGHLLPNSAYPGELPVFEQRYVGTRGAGEPTIAISREGTAIFPSIEFDAIDSPFGSPLAKTIVFRSTDEGMTWEDANPTLPGGAPAAPTSLDPYVYADPATGRLFSIDLYVGCSILSWSDNEAQSWTTNPIACGVPVNDHQTLFSGPPVGLTQTIGYESVLYYCNNQVADSLCTHSLDGGWTWVAGEPVFAGVRTPNDGTPGLDDFCGGLHGHGHASQATGTVYLPKGHCGEAWIGVSEDNGVTWENYLVDASVGFNGHEAIVSTDSAGNVYYFFLDGETMPRLSISRDQGKTWGPPMAVGHPLVTAAKFPTVVAGDEGRVAFLYVGSTVEGGFAAPDENMENATWNGYVGYSLNALDEQPVFATTTANPMEDPLKRGPCSGRCQGMFDFMDIDINPVTGQVWAALVDLCNEACATPEGTSKDAILSRGAVGVQVGGDLLRDETLMS